MKSGAEGAHFFGALLLTFSFDKHRSMAILFFLVFGLLDKKGVAYLVDHYIPKAGNESKRDKEEK